METTSSVQKGSKRVEKTSMMKNLKIKLIALYMLSFGGVTLAYIAFPFFGLIISIYKAFQEEWMIALFWSSMSTFSYITSSLVHRKFMEQNYYIKEKIELIRK